FMEARNYFWQYCVVGLITSIIIVLWTLLFIIPGIIFGVYYGFSYFALIFEGYKSTKALTRSKELVKGYWRAVVGRSMAIGLIFLLVYMILAIPFIFFKEGTAGYMIWRLIMQVFGFFVSPVFVIYQYLIYKDLVGIKGVSKVEKDIVL
ncbi:MAG: hypothetical protein V1860_01900, partial [bacterium]